MFFMGVTIVYNVYKMAADTGIWCGLVSSVERWSVSTGVVIFFHCLGIPAGRSRRYHNTRFSHSIQYIEI